MKFNEENETLKNICIYKSIRCLNCGAETDSKDEEEYFCSKCGAPVVNRCSNYECDKLLKEDADFCKHCGSASIFHNYGLLDKKSPISSDDDLPF